MAKPLNLQWFNGFFAALLSSRQVELPGAA